LLRQFHLIFLILTVPTFFAPSGWGDITGLISAYRRIMLRFWKGGRLPPSIAVYRGTHFFTGSYRLPGESNNIFYIVCFGQISSNSQRDCS